MAPQPSGDGTSAPAARARPDRAPCRARARAALAELALATRSAWSRAHPGVVRAARHRQDPLGGRAGHERPRRGRRGRLPARRFGGATIRVSSSSASTPDRRSSSSTISMRQRPTMAGQAERLAARAGGSTGAAARHAPPGGSADGRGSGRAARAAGATPTTWPARAGRGSGHRRALCRPRRRRPAARRSRRQVGWRAGGGPPGGEPMGADRRRRPARGLGGADRRGPSDAARGRGGPHRGRRRSRVGTGAGAPVRGRRGRRGRPGQGRARSARTRASRRSRRPTPTTTSVASG